MHDEKRNVFQCQARGCDGCSVCKDAFKTPEQPKQEDKERFTELLHKAVGGNKEQEEVSDKKDWETSLENLKCINGAMYFGSVEDDSCNCKSRCQNEQTFEHALSELKDFIRSIESRTRVSAKKEAKKEVMEKLGLMRQWLNEDRIKYPERFVTNEELMVWFDELIEKPQ